VRLAEIVEERGEAHGKREPAVGGRLHDGERVLVDRERVVAALLVEADGLLELRQELHEHTGVPRELQRLRRPGAEQELRQLPHAVRG